jgi:hypothetical protein
MNEEDAHSRVCFNISLDIKHPDRNFGAQQPSINLSHTNSVYHDPKNPKHHAKYYPTQSQSQLFPQQKFPNTSSESQKGNQSFVRLKHRSTLLSLRFPHQTGMLIALPLKKARKTTSIVKLNPASVDLSALPAR